ncbi:MAG: DUF2357 domain-containing protein [Chloroflexi bacterium]|nr:DUF2357 domain-containing protein [Chloroflexota bacterium]
MPTTKLHEGVQVRVRDSIAEYQPHALSIEEYAQWRELGIPRFVCFEWTECFFDATNVAQLFCGNELAEKITNNLFRYTFKNQIGHSHIRAEFNDGRIVTTDIEVLSRKFPSIESHLQFFIALIDDLFSQHLALPFEIESPTYFGVDESLEPPTLLFVYHFLSSRARAIEQAIQIILSSPHRLLTVERERIPIYRANRVDVDSIYAMVTHPEQLQPTNANLAIAKKFKGHAPFHIFQDTPTETLDTPENRFVKHFLEILFAWSERLIDHPLFRERESLKQVRGLLEMAKQNPMFDDVGEMTMFPTTSTVLLKRDGYRELLQLYREFNLSRMPIWRAVQDAIDARDIAKLYEYWCLFKLAQELESVCGKAVFKFNFTVEGTLNEGKIVAEFADGSKLAYNQQMASYSSTKPRPDFVFEDNCQRKIIFDAKFRFNQEDGCVESDAIVRTAKEEDISVAHRYKDESQGRASFIIFPNDNPNDDEYYSETGASKRIPFAELVKGNWRGVGAIGMMPTQRSG